MKRKLHDDVYVGLVIIVLFVLLFLYSATIQTSEARTFPRLCLGVCIITGIVILMEGLKKSNVDPDKIVRALDKKSVREGAVSMLYFALYVAVYYLAGYMISTVVFLVLFMRHLHVKSWKKIIGVTVGYIAIAYLVFGLGFKLNVTSFGLLGRIL